MRLLLLLNLLLAPAAFAAWPPEGAKLTGALGGAQRPVVVADGSGGAFVSWGQWDADPDRFHGYLQHVTATGELAPGWPADGLRVREGPGDEGVGVYLPDGTGGVYVVVSSLSSNYAENDLYLQRYTAGGAVQPGWPAGGVPVVVAPGIQGIVSVIGDAAGGVWISWDDHRDPSRSAAYLTHVLASGEIAPGWPANGRDFEPGPLVTGSLLLLPLADGGFLACWGFVDDPALVESGLRAQRYDASGEPDPLWPAGGVVARVPVPVGGPPRGIAPDGAGGLYVVWEDWRGSLSGYTDADVYAQHVRADGTLSPGWPASGLPVAVLPGVTQQVVTLCENGAGGVYLAWEDYRDGYARVYGQHLAPDGSPYPGWPAGGRAISNLASFQLRPGMVSDGGFGAYVVWTGYLSPSGDRTFVSKLTPDGTPAPGWPEQGVAASTLGANTEPAIAADGFGGAIVAWEQNWPFPPGGVDVYAQRFVRDGIVAASVSLLSAEAGAGEVRLVWQLAGASSTSVERREAEGAWENRASVAADGEGRIEYTDTDVSPGTSYEYRLAFADGTHGGATGLLEVPRAFALALAGARPNPARGAVALAFTLPDAAPAQLALYDLAGRRLAARDVGTLGAGPHLVPLTDAPLAPGLYWATLAHGAGALRARIVVVE